MQVHNVELAIERMGGLGLAVASKAAGGITPRDLVNGHREKTLALLWRMIMHWRIPALVDVELLREETLRVKSETAALAGNRTVGGGLVWNVCNC